MVVLVEYSCVQKELNLGSIQTQASIFRDSLTIMLCGGDIYNTLWQT